MAWKDWTAGTKVVVGVCTLVCLAVIATFAVLLTRPEEPTPSIPPGSSSSASAPSPTPSPSPTYECTTASGPDCTKELSEKEAARDESIAAAVEVFNAYDAALNDQLRAGGGKLSPELEATMADPALPAIRDYMKEIKDEGVYYTGRTETRSVSVAKDSPEWPESYVMLTACTDARDWRGIHRKSGELRYAGNLVVVDTQIEQKNGIWKITGIVEKETKQC